MIDLREINETIDDIKRKGGTVNDAVTLAMLYIAADHMEREEAKKQIPEKVGRGYSQAAEPGLSVVDVDPKSEFLSACNGALVEDVLDVLDEHMDAIHVLYPKEYKTLVEKIKKTHR